MVNYLSKFLIDGSAMDIRLILIIKMPVSVNQLLIPTLSAKIPEQIKPSGIVNEVRLPSNPNIRPKYSGWIFLG